VICSGTLCLVMMMQGHSSLALNAAFPVGLPVVPVELSAPTDLIMGSVLYRFEGIHCGTAKF